MGIFLLIFLAFLSERVGNDALFAHSQLQLSPTVGLLNTIILLTSSWMVVEAVHAARRANLQRVRSALAGALLLGLAFILNKVVEYGLKIHAGISPATNPFFSYYFFITFGHLMHVLFGTICIAYVRANAAQRIGTPQFQVGIENVGLFWHFVDVLWLYIFPLLYLVGRP